MNKLLMILLALQLAGCATARTLDAAQPGAPVVYSGTRLDMYAMNGGCCAKDRFGAEAPSYPNVDLPASALYKNAPKSRQQSSTIGAWQVVRAASQAWCTATCGEL